MACSASYSVVVNEQVDSNVDETDNSEENYLSVRGLNGFVRIQIEESSAPDIKLCSTPNLNYLNLLDYQNKKDNFHSNIFRYVEWDSEKSNAFWGLNSSERTFEILDKYISASIFCFYVNYLINIPKDAIDLQAYDKRICQVVKNLEHCSPRILRTIFNEIIDIYYASKTESILFPIILKYLCTFEEMSKCTTEFFFIFCNLKIFKQFLDVCIDSRFNFRTLVKRNFILYNMPFCPVTYVYLKGELHFLRVLLDYGFQQADHKIPTFEHIMFENPMVCDSLWLRGYDFRYGQRSRRTVVAEVLLFVVIFLDSTSTLDNLTKCFQLVWDARKDPFITKQELLDAFENHTKNILRTSRRIIPCDFNHWFMQRIDQFQTSLPDYQGLVLQPRSLRHLCRCTIREAINDSLKMSRGVEKLPIPKKMKAYILLKSEIKLH